MKRFIAQPIEGVGRQVLLDREESHHLARVLRLGAGARIELVDGSGALYVGRVDTVGAAVAVTVVSRQEAAPARGGAVVVCQGDLRGGKVDFLVQKCTELGVDRFIPFIAGRSQGRADAGRAAQRLSRRRAIVRGACKQCGRLRFMEIDRDIGFGEMLGLDPGPGCRKILLWEKASTPTLAEAIGGDRDSPVCLMLGPEGGFADDEAARARAAGWQPVTLGRLVLRAETAALAAVAVTNHLLGRL